MATWDTYDFDKACEDASWYWITLGSPYITPNQNKSNAQSVFNQMVSQSGYYGFLKGGRDFAMNWADCAARRYELKLLAHGKLNDPAFPSPFLYKTHVRAKVSLAVNQAMNDMAASAAPAPEPTTPSKVALATQARQITALPGQTTARQPAEPSDPFAAIRAAASMAVPVTAPSPAPSTGTSFISRIASMASALKAPTPIVVAPVPMPGVTPQPSWPEEEGASAPQPDAPIVMSPTDLQTTLPSIADVPSSISGARVARQWEGVTYYALPDKAGPAVLALLLGVGQKRGFTLVEEGAVDDSAFVVVKVGGTSTVVSTLMKAADDGGLAVVIEEAPNDATKIWVTRNVVLAGSVTSQNLESAVVREPSSGWMKPAASDLDRAIDQLGDKAKTGLIIGGVVVGVLALGGLAYYYSTRRPAPMRANKRRARKRSR